MNSTPLEAVAFLKFCYYARHLSFHHLTQQWQQLKDDSSLVLSDSQCFLIAYGVHHNGIFSLTIHAAAGDLNFAALWLYSLFADDGKFPDFITFERRNSRPHTYPAADIARHFLPRHLFRRNPSESQP